MARGTKGEQKNFSNFDPSDFDVDAFIVSDELSEFYPSSKKLRDGRRSLDLDELGLVDIQDRINDKLRAHPDLKGLREDKSFTFRINKKVEHITYVFDDKDPQFMIIDPPITNE